MEVMYQSFAILCYSMAALAAIPLTFLATLFFVGLVCYLLGVN